MSDTDDIPSLRQAAGDLWARGKNTQEIANALGVSEAFVFNHKLHRRVTIAAQPEKDNARIGPNR